MNPLRPRRPHPTGEPDAPVELPHVLVRVAPDGTLTATVDGTPFPAAAESGTWTRATFGQLMDAITQDRTLTVRVEVRESDGTVFTDIIHARKPPRTAVPPDKPTHRARRQRHTRRPRSVDATANGFIPGEEVAVALIIAHTNATETGQAHAGIDADPIPATGQEAILLGRVSGTLAVRRLA